jgi:LmbE family N-acetylglucosaminyl deacetylase
MTAPAAGRAPANPIDAPGTSEAAWRDWPELARRPVLDVTAWSSAVIVAAHPDDEVLGPGGIMATLAGAGIPVRVVAVTDGEGSHGGRGDPAALARRRAAERERALHALGAAGAEVIRLGLPDAALGDRDQDIAAALGPLVSGFGACLAPWEHDVHADHEAVGRAARLVSGQVSGRTWFYPVWTWHWACPNDPRVPWHRSVQVPLDAGAAARKRAAAACFASQLEPRPGGAGPVLSADFVSCFLRGYELLFPVE